MTRYMGLDGKRGICTEAATGVIKNIFQARFSLFFSLFFLVLCSNLFLKCQTRNVCNSVLKETYYAHIQVNHLLLCCY